MRGLKTQAATGFQLLLVGRNSDVLSLAQEDLERHGHRVQRAALTDLPPPDAELVLLDLTRDGPMAADVVTRLRGQLPGAPLVAVVAKGQVATAVAALQSGAVDCIEAPVQAHSLLLRLHRHMDPPPSLRARPHPSVELEGRSPAIVAARRSLERAAFGGVDAVLISGPDGSGKTRAMGFLCAHLPRAPAVRLFGAGLSAADLERALVPDSPSSQRGLWDEARGGFLLLEDLPLWAVDGQRLLDRLLDAQQHQPLHRRVRVVATSREPEPMPLELRLRHRFTAAHVVLPPLCERREDIAIIGRSVVGSLGLRVGQRIEVPDETWTRLERAPWPGNVRQLQVALEKAVVEGKGPALLPDGFDLGETRGPAPFELPAGGIDLDDVERCLIEQAIDRAGGNRTRAGLLLGLNRDQVRYRLEKFGMAGRCPPKRPSKASSRPSKS